MILCIGTTPAVQRVMVFRELVLDAVNRAAITLEGAAGKSVNVAKVLKSLGQHPVATGFLGGDRGEYLRTVLETQGVEMDFVQVASRTRQCVTVLDQASRRQTELVEESRPVDPADFDKLFEVVRRRLPGSRAVVMSGTITPEGPIDLYRQYTRLATEAGMMSVVDAQGAPLLKALEAKPSLIKPNRLELAKTVGRDLPDDASVVAAMRELCERGTQQIVVTAGKLPTLASDGRALWRITTPSITVVNPIGSGDAFTAGLVSRLVRGDDLGEACRWASATGAANALTLLAGDVKVSDVERLAREVNVEQVQRL